MPDRFRRIDQRLNVLIPAVNEFFASVPEFSETFEVFPIEPRLVQVLQVIGLRHCNRNMSPDVQQGSVDVARDLANGALALLNVPHRHQAFFLAKLASLLPVRLTPA